MSAVMKDIWTKVSNSDDDMDAVVKGHNERVEDQRLAAKKITLAEYPQLANAHKMIQALDGGSGALDTKSTITECHINGTYRIDAWVVGGAPRDILTNKEIKDVDLFICAYSGTTIASAIIKITQTCAELGLTPIVEAVGAYGGIRITAGALDMVVQDMAFAEGIVKKFDMVSSQAWLEYEDDGFRVYSTDLFKKLDDKKILGYYPQNIKESYDHFERICEKYPDYMPLALLLGAAKRIEPQSNNDDFPF